MLTMRTGVWATQFGTSPDMAYSIPMLEALIGFVAGYLVSYLVHTRKSWATFNEPEASPQKEWLASPKGVTQFFEPVSFKEKFNDAKEITDTLNG